MVRTASMVRALLLTAACAASACGSSILIAHDDRTYQTAIAQYRRTRELVRASLAPDDEQAMFMQAEGMFRYRFLPPPRSSASVVAQVAASAIDLPVLESLSGSFDLQALRLKTYDGAVHIWESLLANAPATKLRDLALYRLGWAYRNTQVSGFKRESKDAFDELAKSTSSPLAPVAAAARATPYKSTGAATAWSIIPGAGQIYAGANASGIARLAVAVAAAAAVIAPAIVAYERRANLTWHHDWPLLASGIIGATVLTVDYSSSYDDAVRRVIERNEQTEAAFEAAHPDAP
jgi:hypothetical protein